MIEAQGNPKKVAPLHKIGDPCAQAKCDYCGRYGVLGQCNGCGANNRPVHDKPMIVPVPPFDISWR